MDLFTYLMAKNNQNTHKDLFSYLLGKGSGGGGTYTTYTGTSLNISNTIKAKIKNFMLNSTELTQDGTPSPSSPVDVNVITGDNNIKISNSDGTEEQNYPISLSSKNLFKPYTNNGSVTSNGVVYTMNSDNTITINGTATGNTWVEILENFRASVQSSTTKYLNLDSTKIYVIKANIISGTYTGQTRFYTQINSSGGEVYSNLNNSSSIANSDGLYRAWFRVFNGDVFDNLKIGIQLEEGSTATTYEPYYNIEYCKIGDYADQIFKNTTDSPYYDNTLIENEWYLKKNVKETNLSTLSWNVYATNKYRTSDLSDNILIVASSTKFPGLSEKYISQPANVTITNGQFSVGILSNIAYMYICDTTGSPSGKMYYPLKTPIYIHISQENYPILKAQLDNLYNNSKSYNGQTNITQTNDDLPFNISVDVKVANL